MLDSQFTLRCEGCPGVPGGRIVGTAPQGFTNSTMLLFSDLSKEKPTADNQWQCDRCYYEHPDPATDPFYQDQVKGLMYFCAVILVVVSCLVPSRLIAKSSDQMDNWVVYSRTLSVSGSHSGPTHRKSGRTPSN